MNPYAQYDNLVPLIAPIDAAATAESSAFIDMKTANRMAFVVFCGNLTSTSADQGVVVTIEAATAAASGSEAAVAFNYRKSGAVGANSWGAITAATSAGVSMLTASDDSKMLWIELDPAAVLGAKADARYVRIVITPTEGTASLVSAFAAIDAAYKQTSMVSAT